MKKIKLFAPIIGASLACISTLPVVACAQTGGEEDVETIKVSLDKSVEHISLTTTPASVEKNKAFDITLKADKDYTIDSTSIKLKNTSKEITDCKIKMSQDNTSAKISVTANSANDDIVVFAKAVAAHEGTYYNFIKDGKFVPFTSELKFEGKDDFISEDDIFGMYLKTILTEDGVFASDVLCNASNMISSIVETADSIEKCEASASIEMQKTSNGTWQISGTYYCYAEFTADGVKATYLFDIKFTNLAFANSYSEEKDSKIRKFLPAYANTKTPSDVLKEKDWKIVATIQNPWWSQADVKDVTFDYNNFCDKDERLLDGLSCIGTTFVISNPHYLEDIEYKEGK